LEIAIVAMTTDLDGDGIPDAVEDTVTKTDSTLTDTDGDVSAMRVGDVNGDYFDDIVIGTSTGKTLWYKNEHPGWAEDLIDSRDTEVYDLDIGDVDRGVTIELERE
ncbi:MAG: hypothetical protein LN409_01345, partial [Candidatus Thermoplasmatota archaeon]|nr:hypothetical protein [Candidatus Thermoplasmatota archaeon]